jgi:signal transduction histidine kinase
MAGPLRTSPGPRELPEAGVGTDRLARTLVIAGAAAALAGTGYLLWRWGTPSECAWVGPDHNDWIAGGIRPSTTDSCALRPGATVTGALLGERTVQLSRAGTDPVTVPLTNSGPLVLQRLWAAAATVAFCGGFFVLALYAALRRPADRDAATTVVMSGALLGSTLATMIGLPAHSAFDGPPRWAFMLLTAPIFLLVWGAGLAWLLRFPIPLSLSRRGDGLWWAALLAPVGLWALAAVPLWLAADGFIGWMHNSIIVQSSITLVTLVLWLVILALRFRLLAGSAPGAVPRQQFLWVAGSAGVAGLITLSLWFAPQLIGGEALLAEELIGVPGLVFVVGFGIAILRHRLFDLDPWLARTLVYAGLTLAAVLVYLVATAILAAGLGNQAPAQTAAIGAVLAALVINPLRVRLERWVNRTIYGDRDDPYAALSRVANHVSRRQVAEDRSADDLRRALRAPYVGIVRFDGRTVASGDSTALANGSVDLPLRHADAAVGALHVALRGAGEKYAAGERRLLEQISQQIAFGLREEQLAEELQRSRERLVTAREEERRALRRALHDETGPTMASVSLRAEMVRRMLQRDPGDTATAEPVLAAISADAAAAAESLRDLAYGLRPPALDEHGLAAALSRYAAAVPQPMVTVDDARGAGTDAPPLSAAVEAALYRIAVAAVDNAVKHAHASTCAITLTGKADQVELAVRDDGIGLPPGATRGVGISAMMERAAELGGKCTVTGSQDGTLVRATIPVGGSQ